MLSAFVRNILLLLFVIAASLSAGTQSFAQTVDELQQQINTKSNDLKALNDEINAYVKKIQETSTQAKTLQNTVKSLDQTGTKLSTDLKVTQTRIESTNLTIQKLTLLINQEEKQIRDHRIAIAKSLSTIEKNETQTLLESVLTYDNLSAFWSQYEIETRFQDTLRERLGALRQAKDELTQNKQQTEGEKAKLTDLKDELSDQKKLVDQTKNQKAKLLSTTKAQESQYQKQLAEAKARKDALEKELLNIESQLKLKINFGSIPKIGSGALLWPLPSIRITQEFGDTEFSRTHAGVYSGRGHNGVDFAAPLGTPVKAAQSGVVKGSGNTDAVCPGASYGQWVFIEHTNGLSTLYAHLSIIKAAKGQQVAAGDVIGYSGNTGYSTGPHLHFTVYASDGVQIQTLKSKVCSGAYTMPIADLRAYLNPLMYLPSL